MTLQELEDAWNLRRRGRRRERLVLAFFAVLVLGGGGWMGWRWFRQRDVAASEGTPAAPADDPTSPR